MGTAYNEHIFMNEVAHCNQDPVYFSLYTVDTLQVRQLIYKRPVLIT